MFNMMDKPYPVSKLALTVSALGFAINGVSGNQEAAKQSNCLMTFGKVSV